MKTELNMIKTAVPESFNFCDPADWRHEIGACDCGEGDCNDCQPDLLTRDHLGRRPIDIHEAEAMIDDRHRDDNRPLPDNYPDHLEHY